VRELEQRMRQASSHQPHRPAAQQPAWWEEGSLGGGSEAAWVLPSTPAAAETEAEWQPVGGAAPKPGGGGGGKKKKGKQAKTSRKAQKKPMVDNGGYFHGLHAVDNDDDDDDEEEEGHGSAAAEGGGGGLSVTQLSSPRLDKGQHADGPWLVDLTLSSGPVVAIGLGFIKDFKTVKCGRPAPHALTYNEKNQALRKYKEARKAEKKARNKQAKESASASPQPAAATQQTTTAAVATGSGSGSALALEGGVASQQPGGGDGGVAGGEGMEVLPGISFVAPNISSEGEAQAWALPPTPPASAEAQWQAVGTPAPRHGLCAAAFPSCVRSILTEIYLRHACSCHEILSGNSAAGRPAPPTSRRPSRRSCGRPMAAAEETAAAT
jgi:hypothetical protein